MSKLSENALKSRLLQLKCHFTWRLLRNDTDIDSLEDRLNNQLKFLYTESKYRVCNLLAYVMTLKGLYPEAIEYLKQAEENIKENNLIESNRKCLVTYGNYAWVYYHLEQFEESQNYIDKIEQINEDLKLSSDYSKYIAEIYGEQGWSFLTFCGIYYEKAKECFQKALDTDPNNPEWNTGYATVVYRLEGFSRKKCSASESCESLSLLQRAIELNPCDAVLKVLLALKLQGLERAEEGIKYVEEALEQAPDDPYLIRYVATFYRKSGQENKALHVLKDALDLTPSSAFLHHQVGLCYKQQMMMKKKHLGKVNIHDRPTYIAGIDELLKKATVHFEKAVEYKKTFVFAYKSLTHAYSEAYEFQKAEDIFKKVLTFPNLLDLDRQDIYLCYGRLEEYYRKRELEAITHYKAGFQITEPSKQRDDCGKALKRLAGQMLQKNPRDARGFGLLGFVTKNNGEIKGAMEYYKKALNYDPFNEEYLSELSELKLLMD